MAVVGLVEKKQISGGCPCNEVLSQILARRAPVMNDDGSTPPVFSLRYLLPIHHHSPHNYSTPPLHFLARLHSYMEVYVYTNCTYVLYNIHMYIEQLYLLSGIEERAH